MSHKQFVINVLRLQAFLSPVQDSGMKVLRRGNGVMAPSESRKGSPVGLRVVQIHATEPRELLCQAAIMPDTLPDVSCRLQLLLKS